MTAHAESGHVRFSEDRFPDFPCRASLEGLHVTFLSWRGVRSIRLFAEISEAGRANVCIGARFKVTRIGKAESFQLFPDGRDDCGRWHGDPDHRDVLKAACVKEWRRLRGLE